MKTLIVGVRFESLRSKLKDLKLEGSCMKCLLFDLAKSNRVIDDLLGDY